jgi:hypothetical protein
LRLLLKTVLLIRLLLSRLLWLRLRGLLRLLISRLLRRNPLCVPPCPVNLPERRCRRCDRNDREEDGSHAKHYHQGPPLPQGEKPPPEWSAP